LQSSCSSEKELWMPILPQHRNAIYYLTLNGDLWFREEPVYNANDGKFFKKSWRWVEIAQDHRTFFEFLKEAKKLGAHEDEIIRQLVSHI